jgi:glycosyltransferase involved in cell wall biosynthesis
VLLEAMACKRPIIATKTSGLKGYLDSSIISIPPEDAHAMQDAIISVLKDPLEASSRADKAHSRAVQLHDTGPYVKELAEILRTLS